MKEAPRRLAALAVAVLAAATCAGASGEPRTFGFADLKRLVALTAPAISPDGKRAVVVVARVNWSDDKYERELDLVDLTTHARRVLTFDRTGLAQPAWSPDGTRLAFIADLTGKPQVFVMPMDGGDARPATKAPEGIEQFAWRPDGGAIAYSASDALPKQKGAERFRDAFTFTTEPITVRKASRPAHLFVIAADGEGKAKQLTTGVASVAQGQAQSTLSWSPDGTHIAFLLAPNGILNDAERAHVELVDVATAKLTRLTTHARYESDPRFSPDGKLVAYAHSEGDNQITLTEAYVTAPGRGNGTPLSRPFDRAVHDIAWLPDSSAILFSAHDATENVIVRAPVDAATPARIDLGDLAVSSPLEGAIARDGTMVFVATTSTVPPELYVRRNGAAPEKVTDFNAPLAALSLAQSEKIAYPTSLGVRADAVLYTPPGYVAGRKYPLILMIHGGPTSASLRSWSAMTQLMAARGWLVLQPNYRGSDNLGLAYQRGVRYDPGAGPGKDIMAALDAVRARGIVDEHRLGVYGWSYGGIMTAWMISAYHPWRAAVSGASVNDWTTDYGTADDSDSDVALFHGSPFVAGNRAEWDRASAINYVHQVSTPVLILSDVGDNRDPFATSSMYYRALRDNGKDATLVAYPVNGHFPSDPVRSADVYSRTIDYIAGHFH
ncbi:MAG: WD40-like beta Propeller containing protein [Candidatus Eremiobacteraeota bacterium]|nr:WD40-like beta Propeller containing protein [Candidatus Eremiobacteraeota bacterium]